MTITASGSGRSAATTPSISLYEAIGGRPALIAAVDGLFERLLADPVLSPFFPGGVGTRHRRYIVTFLAQALGGPVRYRGPGIGVAHEGMKIENSHFDRVASHLGATLNELGVPASLADQVIGIVAGLRNVVVSN